VQRAVGLEEAELWHEALRPNQVGSSGDDGMTSISNLPQKMSGKRTQAGNTCGNNVQINLKQDIIIGSFYLAGSGRLSFWICDSHVSEWISARKLTLGAHDAEMQKGLSLFQQIPASM